MLRRKPHQKPFLRTAVLAEAGSVIHVVFC